MNNNKKNGCVFINHFITAFYIKRPWLLYPHYLKLQCIISVALNAILHAWCKSAQNTFSLFYLYTVINVGNFYRKTKDILPLTVKL